MRGRLAFGIFLVSLIIFIIILITLDIISNEAQELKTPLQPKEMRTDIKVVIDPGHGGIDPGTHDGQGVKEKDITLKIGLMLRDYLNEQGIPVIMTRETDDDVSDIDGPGRHRNDLKSRVKIINQGTVAISIHVNSTNNINEKGCVVFYPKDDKLSKKFAERVLQGLGSVQDLNHEFVVPRTNLYLLKNANVPIVLVEVGFLSNIVDKQKLQDEDFLNDLAKAIGQTICDNNLFKEETDP